MKKKKTPKPKVILKPIVVIHGGSEESSMTKIEKAAEELQSVFDMEPY